VLEVKTQIGLGILGLVSSATAVNIAKLTLARRAFGPRLCPGHHRHRRRRSHHHLVRLCRWCFQAEAPPSVHGRRVSFTRPLPYSANGSVGQIMFGPIGRELLGFAYWVRFRRRRSVRLR